MSHHAGLVFFFLHFNIKSIREKYTRAELVHQFPPKQVIVFIFAGHNIGDQKIVDRSSETI